MDFTQTVLGHPSTLCLDYPNIDWGQHVATVLEVRYTFFIGFHTNADIQAGVPDEVDAWAQP